jgi:hypothetical protein
VGDRDHREFPGHEPGVVLAAGEVGEAPGEDAVEPALEDGGGPEPPHRVLEQHEVGAADLGLFCDDVARCRPGVVREPLLAVDPQVVLVFAGAGVVVGVGGQLPLHRVQVADVHGVALLSQGPDRGAGQRAVEGLRFGVCVDDEDVHDGTGLVCRHIHTTPTWSRVSK